MAIALLLLAVALATLLATRHYDSLISERKNSHNVLGMTTVQRRAAINTYARSFVWDYKVSDGTTSINSAKPAYKNAKPSSATDCSVFVYEVISHSGADSAFPTSGAEASNNQRIPSAANIYWWLSNYSNIAAARVR